MGKTFRTLCVIWLYCGNVFAQANLVPNPSFEEIESCPDSSSLSEVFLAAPWFNALLTPDLFNACATVLYADVPLQNNACYQPARTGVGYAGLINYINLPRTTEFMEVKLTEKLKSGKQYYLIFYVSPRNCGDLEVCYADGIGLAFSETLYLGTDIIGTEQIPPLFPVVQNPAGNIMKDTANWLEVSGCYTAKGTEEYAVIGNFKSSANTQSQGCTGVTGSYVYIDDVGVYEYDPLPDTIVLCSGEHKSIGKTFLQGIYFWNTGSTDSVITVEKGGEYVLSTTIGQCVLSDTVVVLEMEEYLAALPMDTIICGGDVIALNIPFLCGTCTWSDGTFGSHISISESDDYTVIIDNNCGSFSHSFSVLSEDCDCNVYVPNAFSPNNDGFNDVLECFLVCDFPINSHKFQVFDRWGNLLYLSSSSDYHEINWDGKQRGKALQEGVFIWVFEYEFVRNGVAHKKIVSGDVNIVK